MADASKPYGNVQYADPGYQSDGKKRYPIDSEAHCRAAWSYINQAGNAAKYTPEQVSSIKGRIKAAGKKYGITFEADSGSRALEMLIPSPPQMIHRTVPLEDISIKPGDGRTVEALLAVFDTEAEIQDSQGHYKEVIERSAFNKAISDARPNGSRAGWKTSVYYNHAMTPYGTPSERWSAPVAVTQDLIVESRGVRAIDRYMATPDGDYALELVRSGAVKGYSFTGRMIASDPNRPPAGGYRASRNGSLTVVHRRELGLAEYGPTPEPAYETAGVLGMRADFARRLVAAGFTTEEIAQLASATPDGEPEDVDTSAVEAVADEPPAGHSARQSNYARRLSASLTARGIRSDGKHGNETAGHHGPPDGDPR